MLPTIKICVGYNHVQTLQMHIYHVLALPGNAYAQIYLITPVVIILTKSHQRADNEVLQAIIYCACVY